MRRPRDSMTCQPTLQTDRSDPGYKPPMTKRALITGITGQDGSYLAELLLDKGYEVIGMVRRTSTVNFERIAHLQDRLILDPYTARATCSTRCRSSPSCGSTGRPRSTTSPPSRSCRRRSASPCSPARSRPSASPACSTPSASSTPRSASTRRARARCSARCRRCPQTENTPFYPRSPYGVAKVYGHWITVNYRETYDLHASVGHPLQPREPAPRPRVRAPARSATRWPGSSSACRRSCASATSTPSATGASPATTSRPCG